MSSPRTYTNSDGHTFTVVEAPFNRVYASDPERYFAVQERNEVGTFLQVAYTSWRKADADAWCEREAVRRETGFTIR